MMQPTGEPILILGITLPRRPEEAAGDGPEVEEEVEEEHRTCSISSSNEPLFENLKLLRPVSPDSLSSSFAPAGCPNRTAVCLPLAPAGELEPAGRESGEKSSLRVLVALAAPSQPSATPTLGKLDKFCLKALVTATCLKTLMAKGFITQFGSFGEGALSNGLLGATALDASDASPASGWGFDTA